MQQLLYELRKTILVYIMHGFLAGSQQYNKFIYQIVNNIRLL